jgi:hypothetical protein
MNNLAVDFAARSFARTSNLISILDIYHATSASVNSSSSAGRRQVARLAPGRKAYSQK